MTRLTNSIASIYSSRKKYLSIVTKISASGDRMLDSVFRGSSESTT